MTSVGDISEGELLTRIFPLLAHTGTDGVLLGPGDDTALIAAPSGAVLVTTDSMVRGLDWLDTWSTGEDVGRKVVAQNLADIASMGGVATGLVVALAAEPSTSVDWLLDLTRGIAAAAEEVHVPVVGGDLSGAPDGTLMVGITALGEVAAAVPGRRPVRRDGARPGDVVAVAGTLGHAAAGLLLLQDGVDPDDPDAAAVIRVQRAPRPPHEQGPAAAVAGAHAMLDLSDGLGRDAGRLATASAVRIELDPTVLAPDVERVARYVGAESALDCVLLGGEDHSLLATFDPEATLPDGWRPVGRVVPAGVRGVGVDYAGRDVSSGGWDHFRR